MLRNSASGPGPQEKRGLTLEMSAQIDRRGVSKSGLRSAQDLVPCKIQAINGQCLCDKSFAQNFELAEAVLDNNLEGHAMTRFTAHPRVESNPVWTTSCRFPLTPEASWRKPRTIDRPDGQRLQLNNARGVSFQTSSSFEPPGPRRWGPQSS